MASPARINPTPASRSGGNVSPKMSDEATMQQAPPGMTLNQRNGGRGFYFRDPSGHLLEVLTA